MKNKIIRKVFRSDMAEVENRPKNTLIEVVRNIPIGMSYEGITQ